MTEIRQEVVSEKTKPRKKMNSEAGIAEILREASLNLRPKLAEGLKGIWTELSADLKDDVRARGLRRSL